MEAGGVLKDVGRSALSGVIVALVMLGVWLLLRRELSTGQIGLVVTVGVAYAVVDWIRRHLREKRP